MLFSIHIVELTRFAYLSAHQRRRLMDANSEINEIVRREREIQLDKLKQIIEIALGQEYFELQTVNLQKMLEDTLMNINRELLEFLTNVAKPLKTSTIFEMAEEHFIKLGGIVTKQKINALVKEYREHEKVCLVPYGGKSHLFDVHLSLIYSTKS
ncbi:MAG: hypothetical protein ABID61_02600 [Candidatus Micrarchaeota archaeon]